MRSVSLARNEEITDWSDDEAVALNGDWVCCIFLFLCSSPFNRNRHLLFILLYLFFFKGTPEAPRRNEISQTQR